MPFRKTLSLLALVSLAVSLAACDSPEQKEARHIRRGNAYMEKGETEKARIEYKNAARLKPTDAEPLYHIGMVEEQEGNLRGAFMGFVAAEQQNAHFHPAALKIAQYYMAAEQHDEASRRIDAVLAEDPNNAEAHAILAALLLRQKKVDDAEREAKQALAIDPGSISAHSALVGVYSSREDLGKALEVVNDGIKRNPKNLALLMLRVVLYGRANDLENVAKSYEAVFALKPEETQFRVDLANIYVKANRMDDAEASLRRGIAALPDNWKLKHQLVMFLNERRGPEAAEREIQTLLRDNPDKDDLYFWLVDLYARTNAIDKAVNLLNEIVDRRPYEEPGLNARTVLARISIKRGNRDLADKLVAAVLSKAPDNHQALLIRAGLAFESGYTQNAVSDLRAVLRATPDDPEALRLLGETLLVQNHVDLALDTLKKLSERAPEDVAVRVRLAQVAELSGDRKQAMELIGLVTRTAPTYAIGWEAAARIAIAAEDWLPAREAVAQLDKIEGQHLTAAFLAGQILELNGKSEEALVKYAEVVDADPSTPLAEHALKAMLAVYKKLDRIDTAARYLETLRTESPLVTTLLAKCYATLGKKAEAAAIFDKAIEVRAPFADPYLDRAHLYLEDRQTEGAIATLRKGVAVAPGDFRPAVALANLLSEAGKYQEALVLYEDLLTRNPEFDVASNNLAEMIADYLFNDSALLEKARQTAERFSASNNPVLLDTLGWVYFRQGNLPLAQTILERARSLGGNAPQMRYHYGAILMKSGKDEKAREELQQAVASGETFPGIEEARKLLGSR